MWPHVNFAVISVVAWNDQLWRYVGEGKFVFLINRSHHCRELRFKCRYYMFRSDHYLDSQCLAGAILKWISVTGPMRLPGTTLIGCDIVEELQVLKLVHLQTVQKKVLRV